ncbi:restriction endonuclease subunit S [Bacillus altitudinis]|uniref:restriction endonuclease subunit S n=1 Tax=Bacillus altitudinis TaxID=293387 RepID=UPI0035DF0BC0
MSWKKVKLKYLANMRSGDSITSDSIDGKGSYPVYGGGALRGYTESYTHEGNYILIGRQGANCGSVRQVNGKFFASEHAVVVSHNSGVDNEWLYYLLESMNLNQYSISAAQPGLAVNTIKNLEVNLPSYDLQIVIRKYIDKKTKIFETIIKQKEDLIELLEEQRQSIITEAVTKGLNPNVKMKDSGIEWIGEIPEHWGTKKIKYLIQEKLLYGANESAELDDEKLPRYIRITDIDELGNLKNETFKSIPLDIANKYVVKKGDILLARSGATVGKSYIHKEEKEASYAGYLIKLRARTLELAEYIYYFTNSSLYKQWINSILIQATIQNVSAEKYANLSIPVPNDENEIKSILLNIKFKEKEILEVINKLKEQIEKLKEYRQALIYEAVTGKIDVRDMELDEVR